MGGWQIVGLLGTVVATGTGVAAFGWRVLRQETGRLSRESREAHEKIGARIDQLHGEVTQVREGLGTVREGLGTVRGELKGMRESLRTLRKDFRAHVIARD